MYLCCCHGLSGKLFFSGKKYQYMFCQVCFPNASIFCLFYYTFLQPDSFPFAAVSYSTMAGKIIYFICLLNGRTLLCLLHEFYTDCYLFQACPVKVILSAAKGLPEQEQTMRAKCHIRNKGNNINFSREICIGPVKVLIAQRK